MKRDAHDPGERDRAIREALGLWFDDNARDLPWRRRRVPYAVWVSEIMLQQTRVDTVVPYFERFLDRYPDVGSLAAAGLDEVLELWSGLGYYRRARQLHATACEVTARYGGTFPEDVASLKTLPGIGAYTAGAIASIAYGRPEALVDGNVARVLSRIEAIDDPVRSPKAVRALWATAARLLPNDRPGRFNEALMELGALVCTPRDPRCEICPVAPRCVARATGREGDLPVVEARGPVPQVKMVSAVLRDASGKVLFARRASGGLFGGLWEPPMVEAESLDSGKEKLQALGFPIERIDLLETGHVKHVLSHRRLLVVVAVADARKPSRSVKGLGPPYEAADWLDPREAGVGISTLARKVLSASRPPQPGEQKR